MTQPAINPSIQSQVMAAAVLALNGAGGLAFRSRMSTFGIDELPAHNVLPDEGDTDYADADSIDRTFKFRVRHTAAAVDEVDAVVDQLYVAGQKALLADPTLGGLVRYTRERSQKWEMGEGEFDTVVLAVIYEVEFDTSRSDPSVSGT